jgi:glucose-6-phosphate 1-dehydrogenase
MDDFSDTTDYEQQYRTIGVCQIEITRPFGMVIFGGAGNLARKKLIPALYHLYRDRLLQENFFIYCTDRSEMDTPQYRDFIKQSVREALPKDFNASLWIKFSRRIYYSCFHYHGPESCSEHLKKILPDLERKHQTLGNRIFYLAIPPAVFEDVINHIGSAGLSLETGGYVHIVVEKPFGHDLASASSLNRTLNKYFREDQIYRIDHYLAKETVQNMLMFRFANSIFEPIWNRNFIDHVQISVSETIGIEHRADYYESAGILRDMFQSHLFELLAITAVEPPSSFRAERLIEEKIKLFRSIKPFSPDAIPETIVAGQYGRGSINGQEVVSYREESGVDPASTTPTFAAMKVFIDNWRWNGVPFYLRSGKRLAARKTEISLHFKQVPHMMFSKVMDEYIEPNILSFRVQPDEGISLSFQTKRPGTRVCLYPVPMEFYYQKKVFLDAYEWVLLDCMIGDRMLFMKQEEVELTWNLLMPVLSWFEMHREAMKYPNYVAGSSGPDEALLLIQKDGRSWKPLEPEGTNGDSHRAGFRSHKR